MKNRMKFITGALILLFAINSSCKKEGPPGKDGTDGKNGNANVVASNQLTLNNWVSEFDDGNDFIYSKTITWDALTQSAVDNGAVLAYMKLDATTWTQLPFTDSGTGYSETISMVFSYGIAAITITGFDDTGSPGTSFFNGTVIRMVAIPPGMIKLNVNYKNFTEVKSVHNLAD